MSTEMKNALLLCVFIYVFLKIRLRDLFHIGLVKVRAGGGS